MNKTAVKNFAIWARVNLIESAKQKAYEYEITKDGANDKLLESVSGRLLTNAEKEQRRGLIEEIGEKGFEQVMEEAAYTWFNRFIALRFMEVNGYLPSRVRVFTNEEGEFKPEIMKEAMTVEIEGLDRQKVFSLLEKQNNEELYKYLLITQCNALGVGLPKMFEKIAHWTELLFPANLLRTDSVIGKMVSEIPEEDFKDAVQIIGWLYQYYNSELKDDTFAKLKKNIKISKERIPAATQLFTPDWIVRYMVENSLGRLWLEGHPDENMKAEWRYYLDEAEQESAVAAQLAKIREEYKAIRPQDIKVIDPCMGSGHILVYAFDVLMQIYTSAGWSERDAAKSIVENNLYGLDIDDRAGQLAYFAVMMKARKYNRRALAGGAAGVLPNIYAIQESNHISEMAIEDFCSKDAKVKAEMDKLLFQMRDAKEYGSILDIKGIDFDLLFARCDECADEIHLHQNEINEDVIPLIKIAYILEQKYDVVVTNPPYMGAGNMNGKLSDFIKENYADYKSDFFSAFFVRCIQMASPKGKLAFFSPYVWMFIQSYEKWRKLLCQQKTIETLIQFEYSAFEEATVPVCTFAFSNYHVNKRGCYFRLTDFRGGMEVQRQKTLEAIADHNCGYYYEQSTDNFSKIPGSPVAYWVSENFINAFENGVLLGTIADSKQGIATADNNRYLRLWHEIEVTNMKIDTHSHDEAATSSEKWYPYNKGGEFRKWYGNNDHVVNWYLDGNELRNDKKAVLRNPSFYFKSCFSWSLISSGVAAFRYKPNGHIFDVAGMSCFSKDALYYLLGLCNSSIVMKVLEIIAPTINYQCGDIANIPVILCDEQREKVESMVKDNIALSCADWDFYETSWDFKKHPLV